MVCHSLMAMFSNIKLEFLYPWGLQESSHLNVDNYLDPIAASFIKKLPLSFFLLPPVTLACSWRRPNMRRSPQKISWQPRSTNWRFSFFRQNNWNRCSLRNRTELRFYYFWQWPAWKYSIYAQKWKTSMLAIAQNSFPQAMTYLRMK